MGFEDLFFVFIAFFILLIGVVLADFVWEVGKVGFVGHINSTIETNLENSWDKNTDFFNGSYVALFLIVSIISVVLTAMLISHPIVLAVFLLFNVVFLVVYDELNDYLTSFLASSLNTGVMNDAAAFFQTGMPKAIVFLNFIMAIVFLGKRGLNG